MDKPLQEAILTSIVGMSTVFIILLVIVVSAFLLLKILEKTNFIFNKEEPKEDKEMPHLNIIDIAITQWSKGQASVSSVKEIDPKA